MNISVTKTKVSVDTDYILNDSEYNVNECTFSFSDEYTEDLVKKAIFIKDTSTIEMSIINNKCSIPYEVLKQGQFQIRVYAYEVEGDNLILRYSPSYATVYVRTGSYVENAESPEEITPTQFEQYMQAMNDGLNEVANVDINSEQLSDGASITITNREGVSNTTYIYNGQNGTNGKDGTNGTNGQDAKINGVNTLTIEAGDNITLNQQESTLTISATGGGSGGTSNYADLSNKPKINNVELSGNKTTSDLGIVIPDVSNFITKDVNDLTYYTKTSSLSAVATSGNYNDLSNKLVIDNETITTNSDNEIQTSGIKDNGDNTCKVWNGTLQQYNAIQNKDNDTFYNITDDYANNGVPSGGTTGQVLKKASATDFDAEWGNLQHETWTFTLEDDSTVDKEVVLW